MSSVIEVAVMVPAILTATMPSPFMARDRADDHESRKTARLGEFVGGGLVLTLGVAESLSERSWMPLVVVVCVGAAWMWMIEWSLRHPMNGASNASQVGRIPLGKLA